MSPINIELKVLMYLFFFLNWLYQGQHKHIYNVRLKEKIFIVIHNKTDAFEGGALSEIVFVVESEISDPSSIPERGCLHFSWRKSLSDRHDSIWSPPSHGWLVEQAMFFSLVQETSLGKENFWTHTSFTSLKSWLCHILSQAEGLGKYILRLLFWRRERF